MIYRASKTNSNIFKVILTGILDPFLIDQFSGLNCFEKYSFYDCRLMEYYGYSEDEIQNLLKKTFSPNEKKL